MLISRKITRFVYCWWKWNWESAVNEFDQWCRSVRSAPFIQSWVFFLSWDEQFFLCRHQVRVCVRACVLTTLLGLQLLFRELFYFVLIWGSEGVREDVCLLPNCLGLIFSPESWWASGNCEEVKETRMEEVKRSNDRRGKTKMEKLFQDNCHIWLGLYVWQNKDQKSPIFIEFRLRSGQICNRLLLVLFWRKDNYQSF